MTREREVDALVGSRATARMSLKIALLVRHYETIIAHAHENPSYTPPTYRRIAKSFGISEGRAFKVAKRYGLSELIASAKKKDREFVFRQSQETAWFLGAMVAGGAMIQDDMEQVGLSFTSRDSYVLETVTNRGRRVLNVEPRGGIRKVTPAVFFRDRVVGEAIGDFHQSKKTHTILSRHRWVLDDQYKESFASGLLDASPHKVLTGRAPNIKLHTDYPQVARFYLNLLIRLGIKNAYSYYKDAARTQVHGVAITNYADLQKIAQFFRSVNPDVQQQLSQLKEGRYRRRTLEKPNSIQEIVAEWQMLRDRLGDGFTEDEVNTLFDEGETRFSASVYAIHFGRSEETGKRSTFVRARNALTDLLSLSTEDIEGIVAGMSLRREKYSRTDLLTEWKRLSERFGDDITYSKIRQSYRDGDTPYDVDIYALYFGIPDEGGKRSYPLARQRLNEILAQEEDSSVIQIFP